MDMSAACTAPRQPYISEKDRAHPLFHLYSQHRASCSNQLIQAQAFKDWLYQREMHARDDEAKKHPQYREFMGWMIENKGGARKCPAGVFPHNFSYWQEGGRW